MRTQLFPNVSMPDDILEQLLQSSIAAVPFIIGSNLALVRCCEGCEALTGKA
jgi:hypothetical protein